MCFRNSAPSALKQTYTTDFPQQNNMLNFFTMLVSHYQSSLNITNEDIRVYLKSSRKHTHGKT